MIFLWSERPLTQFVRVPPYEILVFPMNLFFFHKAKQFHGVKGILPFSKLIVGKSQVKHPPFLIFSQKCRDLLVLSGNNEKFGDLTGVKDLTNSMCARVT